MALTLRSGALSGLQAGSSANAAVLSAEVRPEQETEFLKYAKHYVRDGPLFCSMMVEAGSFASLAEYRHVRQIGAIYNNSAKTAQKSFPSLPSKADTRMKAYLRMKLLTMPAQPTCMRERLLKSVVVPFEMERLDLI